MTSLREAFDAGTADVRALGDIEAAIATADARTRRRVVVTAGIGAAAAVAVVAALVVLRGAPAETPRPVAPSPSAATVHLAPATAGTPTIAEKPLPDGADVAGGQGAVVWSQGDPRVVLEAFRIWSVTLSPDGRYVAVVARNPDALIVTDVTTGTVLSDSRLTTSAGGPAQSPHVVWSGDSRHLFLDVISTQALGDATGPQSMPKGELQVWSRSGTGRFSREPRPTTLPGELVGVGTDGRLVMSTDADEFTVLDRTTGSWTPTGLRASPSDSPAQVDPYGGRRGGHCWSPDGQRVCWVGGDSTTGTMQVGWLDVEAGTWSVRDVPTFDEVSVVGWRDGRPVVARTTSGGVVLDALTAAGRDRVAAFDPVLSRLSFSSRWDS